MTPTGAPALWLDNIARRYGAGETAIEVLNGADLALWPGQSVALIAPSGAGKSTLLHLAGLLESPDEGEVHVAGAPTAAMSDDQRTALAPLRDRLRLPVPSPAAGILGGREHHAAADDPRPAARRGARRAPSNCSTISASARGRAIARRNFRAANSSASRSRAPSPTRRACCSPTSRPAISIRKPPGHVFETLAELVHASRVAALIATHNLDLAARMDRRVTLLEGRVVEMD